MRRTRADQFLEFALIFTLLVHAFGMLTMAGLLLPGVPGGNANLLPARAAYVAAHPIVWRVGWFGWQLTAASDLLLAIALVANKWIPRWPAYFTLAATCCALVPDQTSQFLWVTRGVELAQHAAATGDFSAYAQFERVIFLRIAGVATFGYVAGAIGWSWAFAAAGVWSRRLTWLSASTWSLFILVTLCLFIPETHRPDARIVGAGNALGFVLLTVWTIAVAERVLGRTRPATAHGRYAKWVHPRRGTLGRAFTALGNSHLLRAIIGVLPAPALRSDIRDVVFVNYFARAETLRHFVPPGLELRTVGESRAVLTCVVYRHGHFGPTLLVRLRGLMPSPIQANWRVYVRDPHSGLDGVYFISSAIDSTPHALAARALCEGVPMHVPASASIDITRDEQTKVHIDITRGAGTAPDLHADLKTVDASELPADWAAAFSSPTAALAHLVPVDRTLSCQPWKQTVTRQEIDLGIPLEACRPIAGSVTSEFAEAIVPGAAAFCVLIPKVCFRFTREFFDVMGEED